MVIFHFVSEKCQLYYRNWQTKKKHKEWEKWYEGLLQEKYRRELHRKEREKYPLFYWRELVKEKK